MRFLCLFALVGLAGCVLPAMPDAPPAAYAEISPEAFASHVRTLADPNWGGRATGSKGNKLAAEYVAAQFQAAGLSPGGDGNTWLQSFQANYVLADIPARNVIGRLDGSDGPSAPTILIGAHYDHLASRTGRDGNVEIFPGADDNASGVSVLLLTARALARTERRCNFVFISFTAEEIGFQGSIHYVHHPMTPLSRTAVLLNVDQVGYIRGGRLLMVGSLLNPTISRALGRVRGEDKGGLSIIPVPHSNTKAWSDQAPFARLGLPTLLFYCGETEYYHSPRDTADRINNAGGAGAARMVFEVARALDYEFAVAPASKVGITPEHAAKREKK